ncbi:BatA domain-containing protein [Gelidibacter salicanalis]|uniref:BatA domain-containing protein n=1 Tax=Gelidibacter salicanalis TaxID=291193 RepID=A0A934NHK1_9FLAO|nr:BatA domain-containing protein [Gelidibacter salicanalis]MBJ7879868.1 BatA domain-containing protein [Gelidibacter salicanalis]
MQFKNPEILYALLLLIIPIIIHLFQLRRFKKEAFTNVQLLKTITIQTRKSSQLKKWLTLLTRMLLLACIIIAFAQPYQSNTSSFNTKSETVIYLDNSFSMQAKGANGTLLNTAVQDLIEHMGDNENISIFTNDLNFINTSIKAIRNDLIELSYSANQLEYDAMVLKGEKAFSKDKGSIKNFVLISDFQQKQAPITLKNDSLIKYRLVQLTPTKAANVSIDSLYISKTTIESLELTVLLSNQGDPIETLPVSLFEDDQLMAKSAVSITTTAETVFTIPNNKAFKGKITIDDGYLNYDNTFYFNLDRNDPIKVLAINEADAAFLKKLYTADEFDLTLVDFRALNYNSIANQNLIILNQLKNIPNGLVTSLNSFSEDGGSILIIPSSEPELDSYNQLFNIFLFPNFHAKVSTEKRITKINFSHPLLNNVFDKKVDNFQYPKVQTHYTFATSGTPILSYEDSTPFLTQVNNTYAFSAALDENNSNFKNSPLIVPIFYNIGKQSLKLPRLYYTVGTTNTIDIRTTIQQDAILKLEQAETAIIPQQKTYSHKVQMITDDYPNTADIYQVKNNENVVRHLSYNYDRTESALNYLNLSQVKNSIKNTSVASAIEDIKSMTNVNELWKWFVIFAIAFLIIEMLILKFLK